MVETFFLYLFRVPVNGIIELLGLSFRSGSIILTFIALLVLVRVDRLKASINDLILCFLVTLCTVILLFKGAQAQIILFPLLTVTGVLFQFNYVKLNYSSLILLARLTPIIAILYIKDIPLIELAYSSVRNEQNLYTFDAGNGEIVAANRVLGLATLVLMFSFDRNRLLAFLFVVMAFVLLLLIGGRQGIIFSILSVLIVCRRSLPIVLQVAAFSLALTGAVFFITLDLTRLTLYNNVVYLFLENPIFGSSLTDLGMIMTGTNRYVYPHNIFLELSLFAGVIGVFTGFLFFLYLAEVLKHQNISGAAAKFDQLLRAIAVYMFLIINISGDLVYNSPLIFSLLVIRNLRKKLKLQDQ